MTACTVQIYGLVQIQYFTPPNLHGLAIRPARDPQSPSIFGGWGGHHPFRERVVNPAGSRLADFARKSAMRGSAASWARVECMGRSAPGSGVGAAEQWAVSSARPSRPSAAGRAARSRLQDAKSPESPFGRRGAFPNWRPAPDWCSPAGQPHAWPEWRGLGKSARSPLRATPKQCCSTDRSDG